MLDQHFNFAEAEGRIYARWEEAGCFRPSMDTSAEPYCIVIPPPNVTGVLHMGHALNHTLQDVLIRFERMRGKNVLWQPGTDHAGIATQMVVERNLANEGIKDRRSMGRESFFEKVWEWKAHSGGQIVDQDKRLGVSADWSRERFTMDEGLSAAVRKVFVQLYNDGLIYRDKKLVNWDPHFQTAISDLEVESREVDGFFWHLRYPLADGVTYDCPVYDEEGAPAGTIKRDYIVVATTRPETMLGDTGVAVHPEDERHAGLVGKHVLLPIVNRRVPIVADEHADPAKGSGAVKITPAHDFNDFEVGERAGLSRLNILTNVAAIVDGAEADAAGIPAAYRGLDRFAAREKVVADFEALGLLQEIEAKKIEQPFGDRSGVVIEPWLTDQWYVNAEELSKDAIRAVREDETRFVPENWEKTYFNWMENIQPWCISRQLWWGHRIPVWYGVELDENGVPTDNQREFVAEDQDSLLRMATEYYGRHGDKPKVSIAIREKDTSVGPRLEDSFAFEADQDGRFSKLREVELYQDEDVLDTWFSSALWPFSTLGWPEETEELKTFYPGAVLVTAFDIIFFWVARMMMMGLYLTKQAPFRDVYIHALVLDEKGQKMSKSKGNAMDPLELVDEFGADALRFSLAVQAAQGRNIRLAKSRIEGYRNFSTKLWNAAKFCQMNECVLWDASDVAPEKVKQPINRWIMGECVKASREVTAALEAYRFNDAAGAVYKFVWNVFCDWHLELIKPLLNGEDEDAKAETRRVTGWVLDEILKLLHPFMPFVTEELWDKLSEFGPKRERFLMLAEWPSHTDDMIDAEAAAEIQWVIDLITEVRSLRGDLNVPAGAKVPLTLVDAAPGSRKRLDTYRGLVERLARTSRIDMRAAAPEKSVQAVLGEATIALEVAELIDLEAEIARLKKEIGKLEKDITGIGKKLENEAFLAKAPEEVVEEQRERLAACKARKAKLSAALERLSG